MGDPVADARQAQTRTMLTAGAKKIRHTKMELVDEEEDLAQEITLTTLQSRWVLAIMAAGLQLSVNNWMLTTKQRTKLHTIGGRGRTVAPHTREDPVRSEEVIAGMTVDSAAWTSEKTLARWEAVLPATREARETRASVEVASATEGIPTAKASTSHRWVSLSSPFNSSQVFKHDKVTSQLSSPNTDSTCKSIKRNTRAPSGKSTKKNPGSWKRTIRWQSIRSNLKNFNCYNLEQRNSSTKCLYKSILLKIVTWQS